MGNTLLATCELENLKKSKEHETWLADWIKTNPDSSFWNQKDDVSNISGEASIWALEGKLVVEPALHRRPAMTDYKETVQTRYQTLSDIGANVVRAQARFPCEGRRSGH